MQRFLETGFRFVEAQQLFDHSRQAIIRLGKVRLQAESQAKAAFRRLLLPLGLMDQPQVVMGRGMLRAQTQGLQKTGTRLFQFPASVPDGSQVVVRFDVIGLQTQRLLQTSARFLLTTVGS